VLLEFITNYHHYTGMPESNNDEKYHVSKANRLKVYTQEEIDHFERSKFIRKYVNAGTTRSYKTGKAYQNRLNRFSQFIFQKMNHREVDDVITDMQNGKQLTIYDGGAEPTLCDVFDMFNLFMQFLKERKQNKLSANVINASLRTTKKFLKFSRVKIDSEEFSDRVQLLRRELPTKTGIEKADVVKLLNGCKNPRLKAALHLLAATGPRPIEACALRNMDVNLDSKNPTVTFRVEFSKMRVARTRPLTKECADQLRQWKEHKYRERWSTIKQGECKYVNTYVKPKPKPDDLFLAHTHFTNDEHTPMGLYTTLQREFGDLMDLVYPNKDRTASNGKARHISLKTFRDFVKTTLSDSIGHDWSEFFIGHAGSTYYQKSERERMELFKKSEPYLTYLDITALEAYQTNNQNQIEELRAEIQKMKEREKQQRENSMLSQEVLNVVLNDPSIIKQIEDAVIRRQKH
jgi:integrase